MKPKQGRVLADQQRGEPARRGADACARGELVEPLAEVSEPGFAGGEEKQPERDAADEVHEKRYADRGIKE
jgi:hypothetical protein